MIHDLSETAKHWLDVGVFTGAIVAGISLANAALVVTIIAGMLSILLGAIRLYDRVKYGHDEH